ncbi:MAG: enoyl-CoA hydratase/isomerase family protein [Candidatus Binataceae bacterium]|jgi:enoyl-CoA hydratase/carnithine racemase
MAENNHRRRGPVKAAASGGRANSSGSRASRAGDNGAVELTRGPHHLDVRLNRPEAGNRISAAMAQRLIELAEETEDDATVYVLTLTGTGNSFCSGFDDDVDPRLVETLGLISKPTAAIINGAAFDEGLELAMALDLRASSASARFALGQLQRGALPRFGGTQRLPRLIGPAHALRMILTGAAIDGREAMRLGLVTYLAKSRADLGRIARELTATLADRGPLGTRMVKDAVRNGYDMTLDQGIRLEEDLYALLQTTADRAEGVRAFLEKRKPLFKGA